MWGVVETDMTDGRPGWTDRWTIIKLEMLYTKPKKKITIASDNNSSLQLECDCATTFVIEATIE